MKETLQLPDCTICRTRHRFGNLWECLVDDPLYCPYMLEFGCKNYCRHHRCSNFDVSREIRKRSDALM